MTWRPGPRAGLAAAVLAVALAWLATTALADERPAELGRLAAAGAVSLNNSREGAAILQASGFRPGASVSGSVTVQNTGEAAGTLALDRSGLQEVVGQGGGRLSQALLLRIQEAGGGDAYVGPLSGLGHLDLGNLPAGAARTYEFTLTLPDGGRPAGPLLGDNALQAASVRVDWTWGAEATVTPKPTPVPPRPTPVPTVPPRGGGAKPILSLRIPWQRVLGPRRIVAYAACDEPCRLRFKARIQTAPRNGGRRRTVQRRKVFRGRLGRRLPAAVERRIPLRLNRRAVKQLKRTLHRRGRVAVVVTATVRSSAGAGQVRRRIVLSSVRPKRRR